MAERVDCALLASGGVDGSSTFGMYLAARTGVHPGSAVPAFTWRAVIKERDFTVGGSSRSAVYPVAQPVVGH
jgi:hypothetical protein